MKSHITVLKSLLDLEKNSLSRREYWYWLNMLIPIRQCMFKVSKNWRNNFPFVSNLARTFGEKFLGGQSFRRCELEKKKRFQIAKRSQRGNTKTGDKIWKKQREDLNLSRQIKHTEIFEINGKRVEIFHWLFFVQSKVFRPSNLTVFGILNAYVYTLIKDLDV